MVIIAVRKKGRDYNSVWEGIIILFGWPEMTNLTR
jgi:hypothetical protein